MDFLESIEKKQQNGNENGDSFTTSNSREALEGCNSKLSGGLSPEHNVLSERSETEKEGKTSKKRPPIIASSQDGPEAEDVEGIEDETDNDVFNHGHFKKKKFCKEKFKNLTRNSNCGGVDFYPAEFFEDGDVEEIPYEDNNFFEDHGLMEETGREINFLYIASLVRPILKTNHAKFRNFIAQISTSNNFLNSIDKVIRQEKNQNLILKHSIACLLLAFNPTKQNMLSTSFEKTFYELVYKYCGPKTCCMLPNQRAMDHYIKQHQNCWFLV